MSHGNNQLVTLMTRPAELAKANVKGKTWRGPERTILERFTVDAYA
jgi:hypothetical protein